VSTADKAAPPAPGAAGGLLDASRGNLFKYDGPAGTVVFLVALPLCLGIALASGAPLFSGIIAGIVGGIVVGWLSGSQISVSGPAAGLAVIVANGIQKVGDFPSFLAAVVLAGALQFIFGVIKFGSIANYVPNSVIKGMLAGIGIVIILKQIPHALGRDKDYEGDFSFLEAGGNNTLSDIAEGLVTAAPGAVIISIVSLVLLVAWDKLAVKVKLFRILPGPLVVVVLGIILNRVFGFVAPSFQIVEPEHLVSLPVSASASDFIKQFTFPSPEAFLKPVVLGLAGVIAVVASVESLLSLEAADRLDPYKRISSPNRELIAQGVGNMISGLIGGLPVTSVVVRTSANAYAGARTWMSTFTHGVLLLVAVFTIPGVLNMTPLACLAAILIVIGYKLTKPALYKSAYRLGWDQFIPFVVTVTAVVFIDLLTGVLVGLACGALFVIRTNHYDAVTVVHEGNNYLLRFTKDASFINKNEFRSKLRRLPENSNVVIDGTRALFIDQDIMESVEDFQKLASYKNIHIELKNWESARL